MLKSSSIPKNTHEIPTLWQTLCQSQEGKVKQIHFLSLRGSRLSAIAQKESFSPGVESHLKKHNPVGKSKYIKI